MIKPHDLPEDVRSAYLFMANLPDGRLCGIHQLLFHWTLHVDIDYCGYRERYCYQTFEGAFKGWLEWSGKGDPQGWHRHPETGRRRNPTTGEEWIEP